mmetsp:Transcript_18484/g.25601  ORF Transcript_18484/g.25601 Transcript_18484/m.25601 type:complete len:548 (-) Transcript_18484:97-1740(-)|eukprot:CAMPEP_0196585798 /NCGR_PEP_ID=MMETSP1081-20130531/52068_1 /TAXON_ID=36882 /ORGANISM="Pyramimonas amylifera, Strain CCMP720" /LENGTH=547 /DNA_ID=CAMNT_0041907467 /DNA_START=153 /DNA_END=1796 /DNA_ORIENTATION=-
MENGRIDPDDSNILNPVTTLAGCGMAKGSIKGYKDGKGTAALFDCPSGLVVDGMGNRLVVDVSNHRIRKISIEGVVSTLAGSGAPGFADGQGEEASFWFDFSGDLVVDRDRNVIVADTGNHCIRMVTIEGVVTTLAGSGGVRGRRDGQASLARFNRPHSVTLDQAGNLYVADTRNNCIRKITMDGMVSTFAGRGTAGFADGLGTDAHFSYPVCVCSDLEGNLFVADCSNRCIRRISSEGMVSTLSGHRDHNGNLDGPGHSTCVNGPFGVVIDGDDGVIVAHRDGNRIFRISKQGLVTTLAGNGSKGFQNGPGANASFNCPTGVTIDRDGNVLVSDTCNHCVRIVAAKLTPPKRLVHNQEGVLSDPQSPVCRGSSRQRTSLMTFNDVNIHIGAQIFHGQSNILARSPYFMEKFSRESSDGAEKTVKLENIRPEVFENIHTYLYTDKITFPPGFDVLDLHSAAKFLKLTSLQESCIEEIRQRVDIDNLIRSLRYAKLFSMDSVKSRCIEIATTSVSVFARVLLTRDYIELVNKDPSLHREFLEACACVT